MQKRVTVQLGPSIHKKLKILALERDLTLSSLISFILKSYLDKHPSESIDDL